MTNNTFFLREDYTRQEKIDRIPSAKITPTNPVVREILEEIGGAEASQLSKQDFLHRAREDLGEDRYNELVEDLFDEWGKKGDPFNLQIYRIPDSLDLEDVVETAERIGGNNLEGVYSEVLSEPLKLEDYRENSDANSVSLAFKTAEKVEDLEPTEDMPIRVKRVTEDGNEEEHTFGPDWEVIAPTRDVIEASVYPDKGVVAISNFSNVNEGVQSDVAAVVSRMGGD